MTYDSYYIVKSIIYSILTKCPEILPFFKLLDLDIAKDIFYNDSETVRRDYTEIFISFIKALRELKLDYNILIVISQADSGYNRDNLQNFMYLIRQALPYMPAYLKFIFTLTEDTLIEDEDLSRILLLNDDPEIGVVNEINLISADLSEKYDDKAFELIGIGAEGEAANLKEKCEGDFERILDLAELLALKIPMKEAIETYDMKLAAYLMAQMEACEDTASVNILLRILCCIKMPIELPLLVKI